MSTAIPKKYILFGIIALAAFAWLFWGNSNSDSIHYATEPVEIRNIEKKVIATGVIAPVQMVEVGAQVSGQIEELYVKLGQTIREGDLIAQIDSTTQLNDLNRQKAQLEVYQAQLAARQITLKVARQKYTRESALRKNDATSRESFEDAEDAYAKAKADVAETESLIVQTQISVSTAEANLGYTKITAPMSGTVVAVPVEKGQTVNANQTTPTIIKLADLTRMEVKLQISEGDITHVAAGMPVSFTILSEPRKIFSTTISSIDPGDTSLTDAASSSSPSSSENSAIYYYGRLVVDNHDGWLRNGMTALCTISVASAQEALAVPTSAIIDKEQGKYVRIRLSDGSIEEKQITTGLSEDMYTEVLSGISLGDHVVTAQMSESELQARIQSF